jgi:ABC-2 type transport system permease protein
LVTALEESAAVDLHQYPSQQAMEKRMSLGDEQELGLVIPADFDQRLTTDEQIELAGYMVHWVSDSDVDQSRSRIEEELGRLAGRPVPITLDGNRVDIVLGSANPVFPAAMSVVFAFLMISMGVVPHLMIEEKQSKTLDALMASPARSGHLVIAKALTGLFYSLTAAVIVYAFNATYIVHWGVAILIAIAGSLFTVALGLLLGTVVELAQQLTLWGFVVLSALLLPPFMTIMSDILPGWVNAAIHWIPTVALVNIFQISCAKSAPLAEFGPGLTLVIGSSVLILAAVTWFVRQSDR